MKERAINGTRRGRSVSGKCTITFAIRSLPRFTMCRTLFECTSRHRLHANAYAAAYYKSTVQIALTRIHLYALIWSAISSFRTLSNIFNPTYMHGVFIACVKSSRYDYLITFGNFIRDIYQR